MRIRYQWNRNHHYFTWVPTAWCQNPMTIARYLNEVCVDVLLPEREPCFGDPPR